MYRHDWNLLSTASPAINAWMNPSNRFAMRLVHMLRTRYRRCTAVVTCLMAEALDIQSLHIPLKVNIFSMQIIRIDIILYLNATSIFIESL